MRVTSVGSALDGNKLNRSLERECWNEVIEPGNGCANVVNEDIDDLSHCHQVDGEAISDDGSCGCFIYENR